MVRSGTPLSVSRAATLMLDWPAQMDISVPAIGEPVH